MGMFVHILSSRVFIMEIKLESKKYKINKKLKVTKAKMFKDCFESDILQFSIYLKDPGRGRNLYATYVFIENITRNISVYKTLSELEKILKNFEFEIVE